MRLLCLVSIAGVLGAAEPDSRQSIALQKASAEQQKASVRIQKTAAAARNPTAFMSASAPVGASWPEQIPCEIASPDSIPEIVDEGARRLRLSTNLVRALVRKGSAYNARATSVQEGHAL